MRQRVRSRWEMVPGRSLASRNLIDFTWNSAGPPRSTVMQGGVDPTPVFFDSVRVFGIEIAAGRRSRNRDSVGEGGEGSKMSFEECGLRSAWRSRGTLGASS